MLCVSPASYNLSTVRTIYPHSSTLLEAPPNLFLFAFYFWWLFIRGKYATAVYRRWFILVDEPRFGTIATGFVLMVSSGDGVTSCHAHGGDVGTRAIIIFQYLIRVSLGKVDVMISNNISRSTSNRQLLKYKFQHSLLRGSFTIPYRKEIFSFYWHGFE